MKEKSTLTVRALCEGAIFIALAVVLSLVPIWKMPQGGSFDLAMLPIFIYCVRWGFGPAMIACPIYGIIQFFIDGGTVLGWQSFLGDYLIAYALLGLSGLFCGKKNGFFWGVIVGACARFLSHYIVGATIWAQYMPEKFFNMTMTTPWFYSLLYNGAYMLIDTVAILIIGAALWRTSVGKYLRGEDIRRLEKS